MMRHFGEWFRLLKAMAKEPLAFLQMVHTVSSVFRAHAFSRRYADVAQETNASVSSPVASPGNPLWEYFQKHKEGHGIWKWEHYFDIYHRHFARFVGQKVNVLEIGVYGGGSLEMWRSYFGPNSHIIGVDIEEACKAYENEHVSIFIGDQADRAFWRNVRNSVQRIDVLIDDGGHTCAQQRITLEEMLPCLEPGGVYLCEDVTVRRCFNKFSAFSAGLVHALNHFHCISRSPLQSSVLPFQSSIHSIHFYPYVAVIEKHQTPLQRLSAPKQGTEWQPFS